jgi:hypothetical protein
MYDISLLSLSGLAFQRKDTISVFIKELYISIIECTSSGKKKKGKPGT